MALATASQEPTASADISAIEQIEQALLEFCRETSCTLLFSTHAPAQAGRLADHVLLLNSGKIGERGETEQVLHHPKEESTRLFLKDWNF